MTRHAIYLDDVRTPIHMQWVAKKIGEEESLSYEWTIVRSYEEFVAKVEELGLGNIDLISLDHDLGPSAIKEWKKNVYHNYELNYDNIEEKTGYDCAKWLVEKWLDGEPVVQVVTHSANAIGSANIMGYINNYKHIHKMEQDCLRVNIPHTVLD